MNCCQSHLMFRTKAFSRHAVSSISRVSKMTKPVLGYWDIRGFGEFIRYLLHYKNIDFEDKRYPPDVHGSKEWKKDKFNLGLDFPNLPYYIDGDIKLTHSSTIMKYLANRHGLIANTKEQYLRTIVAETQCVELLQSLYVRTELEQGEKEEFLKRIFPKFQQWDKFIGERRFVAGDDITYVDFMLYETLDFYRLYHETILNEYPLLQAYFIGMKNLPGMQKYLNSPLYKNWPISKPSAKFGGSGDPPSHA